MRRSKHNKSIQE